MKTVKFHCDSLTVYTMYAWDFAYRNARRGHWEEIARDRGRFQRRIVQITAIIESVLKKHIVVKHIVLKKHTFNFERNLCTHNVN